MVPPLPHLNGPDACELHFCLETNWHGQGVKQSRAGAAAVGPCSLFDWGNSSFCWLQRLASFEVGFLLCEIFNEGVLQTGLEKASELLGLPSKVRCPWFCNQELRFAGSAGWCFGAPEALCSLLLVRLALTFPEPAAWRCTALLVGGRIFSAEASAGL